MVDRFVEEIDDAFRRDIETLPTDVDSHEELEAEMVERVMANDKLSDLQKEHCIENIVGFGLAERTWYEATSYRAERIRFKEWRRKRRMMLEAAGERRVPEEERAERERKFEKERRERERRKMELERRAAERRVEAEEIEERVKGTRERIMNFFKKFLGR